MANLQQFENFGEKYRGTAAQANTLQWLKDKYASYGYSEASIVEDPFTYAGTTCKNLVVTKQGTVYPDTYVIICGHYDTVNGPGTNDNGSGVSVILEIARLLQNYPTEYSIRFINFSGEEDGLIGSQHYVDEVVNGTNMDIRVLLNLDQVGGVAGETNNTITCERDQSNSPSSNNAASNQMTTQLRNCIELYSNLNTVLGPAYGSDYVPFEDNGEIITGLYEFNESPYPHTANDVLANMDPTFVYNVAQGATGAIMHFAAACTTCTLGQNETALQNEIKIYPNPVRNNFNITAPNGTVSAVSIFDLNGRMLQTTKFPHPVIDADISMDPYKSGTYIVRIDTSGGHMSKLLVKD